MEDVQASRPVGVKPAGRERAASHPRSLIRGLRDLIVVGQFAHAQLVQNLARLLITPVIDLRPLEAGQQAQRLLGGVRVEGEAFRAAMMLSRPKRVTYHGTPAAMYSNPSSRACSRCRSKQRTLQHAIKERVAGAAFGLTVDLLAHLLLQRFLCPPPVMVRR